MAAQNLTTNITINAVAKGFDDVGKTLTQLGNMVNGVSQRLISFGEESIAVYRDYEKSMRDAEVALSTNYGRNTKELAAVMNELDAAATEWAATTIFHTDDVANAISEAAHAGWDMEQIMSAIPAAMELAQAGSLDLSEAVNYIVKSSNALGIELTDSQHGLENFIDLWAYAANSSASTIGEFGDAMLRMGSTMRFSGNTEELMTLIAVTANAGATGSTAGTLIRNSMLRLVAPTKKARDAMGSLGATTEETADLLNDEALAAANARLEAYGFSAFDEQGNLKNILDIYRELYMTLGDVAGGFENIEGNKDALEILSAIFPTRSITEALTLVRGAAENYGGLYDEMINGAATGYGAYAAETMMDTLNGRIETFLSKLERLKQVTGEELSGPLSEILEMGGEFIDGIATLDDGSLSALVQGLTVVAGAGPGLLAAGSAFRLLAFALGNPVGTIGLSAIALASFAAAMDGLDDAKFEGYFGNMAMDSQEILSYAYSLGNAYREANAEVERFGESAQKSLSEYETLSGSFSSTLFSAMVEGGTLTDKQKDALTKMADEMVTTVQQAITDSNASDMSYFAMLLGADSDAYGEIAGFTEEAYNNEIAQAEQIGKELREAILGMDSFGPEEYQQVLGYVQQYNDLLAQAAAEVQDEEDYISFKKLMNKAQTASVEDIETLSKEIAEQRDAILQRNEEEYQETYWRQEKRGMSEEWLQENLTPAYEQKQAEIRAQYAGALTDMYEAALQSSGLSDAYGYAGDLTNEYLTGNATRRYTDEMMTQMYGQSRYAGQWFSMEQMFGTTDREKLGEYLASWMSNMGGQSTIADTIAKVQESGNQELADRMSKMYAVEEIVNGFALRGANSPETNYIPGANLGNFEAAMASTGYPTRVEVAGDTTQLESDIAQQDGKTITTNVSGNFSSFDAALAARAAKTITVNVAGRTLFASGGRATEASIFGEAGPEWAIPEQHNQRTASLLDAARQASGFTWPELIARNGGLNAGGGEASTLIYSPTIYAQDAAGVDSVLRNDKDRMDRWYEEKKMRDRLEVYA